MISRYGLRNKKGISVWISWVMIVGFAVILGTFFFRWAKDFTTESVADVSVRNDLAQLCSRASISLVSGCQETQTLNINISNAGDIEVDELLFRFFDIYGVPKSQQRNISLAPDADLELTVQKQGILAQAEAVPVLKSSTSRRILCEGDKVTIQPVPFC